MCCKSRPIGYLEGLGGLQGKSEVVLCSSAALLSDQRCEDECLPFVTYNILPLKLPRPFSTAAEKACMLQLHLLSQHRIKSRDMPKIRELTAVKGFHSRVDVVMPRSSFDDEGIQMPHCLGAVFGCALAVPVKQGELQSATSRNTLYTCVPP